MRPHALLTLLESVKIQTLYPDEILIVDGSTNNATKSLLEQHLFSNLTYYNVDEKDRGLTKQRNFGLTKVSNTSEVVCFLDDDVILASSYFEHLIGTYQSYPDALAVGGYISNEVVWEKGDVFNRSKKFYYDGWMRDEPLRFRIRNWFGLAPDSSPCHLPTFSHGRSVSFLPPTGKVYKVEHFMGGVSSYKRRIFDTLSFSTYFEGYGLYEDADFCFRVSKLGTLYVNTKAQLTHHHEVSGRPNQFRYGQMVVRNGWYIWRVRYPNPTLNSILKWHLTELLLMKMTFLGIIISKHRKNSLNEGLGRLVGWFKLVFNKPKISS